MANRFPLVLDTTDGNKIKEIPAGDNLDLRNVSIEDVQNINALGTINAAAVQINGENLRAGIFTDLTDVPNSYTGFEGYLVKVKDDASGLEFTTLGAGGTDFAVNDILLSGDIVPETLNTSNIGSTEKRFAQIHSQVFQGSLKGFDGSTVFDATSNQIPYAVIAGRPENVSDLPNDAEYITRAQLKATLPEVLGEDLTIEVNQTGNLIGSVFGEDSTVLVDHINSRINAARLTQNGAADGQTIVWNDATQVWEPGIAGDITGLSSNKVDTLTVEAGYKFTFGANPGLIEADGLEITTNTDPVSFNADIELQTGKTIVPDADGAGSVGTAALKFGNGYFDSLEAAAITGALTGNADTATALATPIAIAGVTFDGSANIEIAATDLSDVDQSLATTDNVQFARVTGDIVTSSITGTTINITPSVEIVAGNLELTDDIYPDTNNTGKVGTSTLKFAEGNFVTVNSDSISVSSFSTSSITTEDLTVTGLGTGDISSGTDLVFTAGNRSRFSGGPVKLTTLDQTGVNLIVAQNGDSVYNTSEEKFQFYQNGAWISLHEGFFEGDVQGSIYADDSTVIFDGTENKLISPTVNGTATFENNVVVQGNLTVQGSTTTIETIDTEIRDNLIILNSGETGAGVSSGLSGIQIDRGTETDVSFFFNESTDRWYSLNPFQSDGGFFGNLTGNANGDHTGTFTGTINASGKLDGDVNGSIFADDSTLIINGQDGSVIANNLTVNNLSDTFQPYWLMVDANGNTSRYIADPVPYVGGMLTSTGTPENTLISGTVLAQGYDIVEPNLVNATGNLRGDVVGSVFADDSTLIVDAINNKLIGTLEGDVIGSVYADNSTQIIDGIAGQVVGPINSNDGSSTISMTSGITLVSTGGVSIAGAASSSVSIGTGTTGDITIGHGSNDVSISTNRLQINASNVPASSLGSTGDEQGMIAFDSTSIYYCIADYDGVSDIWVKQDWGTTGSW